MARWNRHMAFISSHVEVTITIYVHAYRGWEQYCPKMRARWLREERCFTV
jgi:hypothetical protein